MLLPWFACLWCRRVQLLNLAVGEPGTLLAGPGCNGSFQGQAQGQVVPVVPLSSVVTQPGRFKLVKIDTEGAEVQVSGWEDQHLPVGGGFSVPARCSGLQTSWHVATLLYLTQCTRVPITSCML